MQFTLFDGGVALVIVLSAILAFSRGFVREALAITGWIVAAIVAYLFAPQATPLVREIPVLKDFIDNCPLATGTGFVVVFAIALVVFALFTPLFSSLVQRSAFNAFDQGLGFLFGALRGMLLIAIALLVYDFVAGSEALAFVDESQSAKIFATAKDRLSDELANQEDASTWLITKFEDLMDASCGAPTPGAGTSDG